MSFLSYPKIGIKVTFEITTLKVINLSILDNFTNSLLNMFSVKPLEKILLSWRLEIVKIKQNLTLLLFYRCKKS